MKRVYQLTLNQDGIAGIEEVTIPARKRTKHRLSFGQMVIRALLLIVYHTIVKIKNASRDTKEGLAAIALICVFLPIFFHLGVMEHPGYGGISRFGTALLQGTCVSVLIVYGKRIISDFISDIVNH